MSFAKKSFGQHFLHDQSHIERIIQAADITPSDLVVEVGPGQGALTTHLSKLGRHLELVELDRDLFPALRATYGSAILHEGDAATLNFGDFVTNPWVFISNLPYNAGNAILMNILTTTPIARRIVVMLQKEVGERIAFQEPKSRGVLGLAIQSYAHVEKMWIVPPGAFRPPPKVDSMVLVLKPKALTTAEAAEAEVVIALAKLGFIHRRQQLKKTLGNLPGLTPAVVEAALVELGHTRSARPQELTLEDWFKFNQLLPKNSGIA